MNALGWLILGLLVGWAVEFAIDFFYWRKKARLEAEALVQQEALLLAQQTEFGHKQSALRLREKEVADLQASVATRDAELLQAARRMEERSDDLGRLEQQTEKRRADLDRMSMTLSEREKDIATRQDQLRSKEADYGRRLNALEATEQELARRVAVVANREDAMQSWEGRILSREHDVTDREASVNYYAGRIASDAAAFDATKHLLKQRHRTAEGRDNLQALVGIDPKIAELLHGAGIRTFERLAETSLGELTRILEGAGPRFALANPLSWAEQAAHWLNEDYVALDRLQCELLGIEREPVGEQLFAQMTKPAAAAQGAEATAAAAQTDVAAATDESVKSETGEHGAEAEATSSGTAQVDHPAQQQLDQGANDPAMRPESSDAQAGGATQADSSDEKAGGIASPGPSGVQLEGSATSDDLSKPSEEAAESGISSISSAGLVSADDARAPEDSASSADVARADGEMLADAPEGAVAETVSMPSSAAVDASVQGEGTDVVQADSDEADALLSLVAEEVETVPGDVWKDRARAAVDAEDVTVAAPASVRADQGR